MWAACPYLTPLYIIYKVNFLPTLTFYDFPLENAVLEICLQVGCKASRC